LLPSEPMRIRTYAAQWIMAHSVARHLGISDEEVQGAIQAARPSPQACGRSTAQCQPDLWMGEE
jgi:hypothetical protein